MTSQAAPTSELPTAPERGAWQQFVRLVGLLRPYSKLVISSVLLSWILTASNLAIPWLTGKAIDAIRAGHRTDTEHWVVLIVAAGLGVAIFSFGRRVTAGTISLGLEKSLRDRLFAHLSRMSHSFFDTHQTGQLLSRATVDVTQVRFFLGYGLPYFFMNFTTLIAVPIVMLIIDPELSLVAFAMIPIVVTVSTRYSRRSHPVMREVQQREADVTQAAEENIIGARVVRAFGQEQPQIDHFRALTRRIVDKERETYVLAARYQPLYDLIPNIGLSVIVLLGAIAERHGQITLGQLFSFFLYLQIAVGPMRIVGNLVGRAQRATASSERLHELLDADMALPMQRHPESLPGPRAASSIEFDRVSFGFATGPLVIRDVTLRIDAGETIALLGPTGSGKTTLASLVPRFYDPAEGRVLVDGIDVRDLDLEELRMAVGVVNQEPFLFSDTVRGNVLFGAPDATDDEVWDMLDAAQAREFVERLPQGLDTMIGERGLALSGGQRQRLAIARALAVKPRILILDDATASVDSRVEAKITGSLHGATSATTTILIAHRPSTIALADRIVILDDGRIVDEGTHDELIRRNELYAQIQAQKAVRREFLIEPERAQAPASCKKQRPETIA